MKKFLLCVILVCCTMICVNAQLKVYSNGRARIGDDYYERHGMFDPEFMDTTTQLRVLGPGYMGANPRLSLGAQYFKNAKTVMIGEVYSTDNINSDVLWLHGANGFAFTQNSYANDTIFKFDNDESEFSFKYPVKAEGILLTSDERLKENVNKVEGALESIAGLNGVTYNYIARKSPMDDFVPQCEYEQKYKDYYDKYYADLEEKRINEIHYGFIAQQVQAVLPDLVHADKDGNLSVDYIGVIPLLVNAIQELKNRLEVLENCEDSPTPTSNNAPTDNGIEGSALLGERVAEVLSQNDPNPFSSDTRIGYNLPDGTQQATIYIYDLQGKQVKRLNVDARDNGVTLQGGDLQAGMYIYSLIADGKELASKKMILTK